MKNSKRFLNILKEKCGPVPVHPPQFYMKLPEREGEAL
jgi:hypothetical protein